MPGIVLGTGGPALIQQISLSSQTFILVIDLLHAGPCPKHFTYVTHVISLNPPDLLSEVASFYC